LFGCGVLILCAPFASDTENDLNSNLGGYEHVTVDHGLNPPSVDLLRMIPAIQSGSESGDLLDARAWWNCGVRFFACRGHLTRRLVIVIVSLELLKEKTGGKKFKRRVFLVTDAAGEIEDQDQVPVVMKHLQELECRLDIMYVGCSHSSRLHSLI